MMIPFSQKEGIWHSIASRTIPSGDFQAGDNVELSASVLLKQALEQGESIGGSLEFWDSSRALKTRASIKLENLPGEWQNVSGSTLVPADFDESWLVVLKLVAGRKGHIPDPKEVYFDNVKITINDP